MGKGEAEAVLSRRISMRRDLLEKVCFIKQLRAGRRFEAVGPAGTNVSP